MRNKWKKRSGEGYIDTAVKILIAVVLGSPTSAQRFDAAQALLRRAGAGSRDHRQSRE